MINAQLLHVGLKMKSTKADYIMYAFAWKAQVVCKLLVARGSYMNRGISEASIVSKLSGLS